MLRILFSIIVLLVLSSPGLGASGPDSLPFEMAEFPKADFTIEEAVQKANQHSWRAYRSGDSLLEYGDVIEVYRFKIPDSIEDEQAFYRIYSQAYGKNGFGTRFYIVDGSQVSELPATPYRYAATFVKREHYGKELWLVDVRPMLNMFVPFMLVFETKAQFYETGKSDQRYIGYMIGIVGIMITYNIGMFVIFRKAYLVHYVVYSSAVLLHFMQSSGLFGYGELSVWVHHVAYILAGAFVIIFSMNVLNTASHNPILARIGRGILVFYSFFFAAIIFGSELAAKSDMIMGPPSLGFCFLLALVSAYKGYRPAYAMMIGWSGLALAITLVAMQYYFPGFPNMGWAIPIAIAFETATFSFAMGQKLRINELKSMRASEHAFNEMSKMVYAHQLDQIRHGKSLESTMPTHAASACVLSFDIVGSSRIKHIKAKDFFRKVFARCYDLMSEGYDGIEPRAKAYRVKEMGDGFLCSIGYPFQSLTDNPANDSIELAASFAKALAEEARILDLDEPITCGIGIAIDTLTGFYPEAGAKEYDLFGQALILATRYEGMRKVLFEHEKRRSILIIQEAVYASIDREHRQGFERMDINEKGVTVRDDPGATTLYYRFFDSQLLAVKASA